MHTDSKLNSIVISSSVSLKRNLKNYPFLEKMTLAQKCELLSNLTQYISAKSRVLPFKFNYNEPALLTENELNVLIERNMADESIKEQTEGKGIFTGKNEKISISVNSISHIYITSSLYEFNLDEAYNRALTVDDIICDELPLAFSESYGYLFSDTSKCGTGLEVSALLHLPFLELSTELKRYADNMSKFGISIEKEGIDGGLYKVKNTLSAGISEKESIKNLSDVIKILANEELILREELKSDTEILRNMIISVETLKNSMELSYSMLLYHISLIRIGVSEGLIFGIDTNEINKYTEMLADAVLKLSYENENIEIRRAKLIKSLFEKVRY